MTGWTAPPDFVATTIVTEAQLDTLSTNETYLLTERPYVASVHVHNADYTTTSDTFADVDATNLIITLTPNSTRVEVSFGFHATTGADTLTEYDIYSVGLSARFGHATHGMACVGLNSRFHITLAAIFVGLTAGVAQSFKLQYRSVTNTKTSTINANNYPIVLLGKEI